MISESEVEPWKRHGVTKKRTATLHVLLLHALAQLKGKGQTLIFAFPFNNAHWEQPAFACLSAWNWTQTLRSAERCWKENNIMATSKKLLSKLLAWLKIKGRLLQINVESAQFQWLRTWFHNCAETNFRSSHLIILGYAIIQPFKSHQGSINIKPSSQPTSLCPCWNDLLQIILEGNGWMTYWPNVSEENLLQIWKLRFKATFLERGKRLGHLIWVTSPPSPVVATIAARCWGLVAVAAFDEAVPADMDC